MIRYIKTKTPWNLFLLYLHVRKQQGRNIWQVRKLRVLLNGLCESSVQYLGSAVFLFKQSSLCGVLKLASA